MTQATNNTKMTAKERQAAAMAKLNAAMAGKEKAPAATSTEKRPAPELYLNIGYDHPTMGRINLPYNLPLDTMNFRDLKGTEEWKIKASLSNALLTNLRELVGNLEVGQDGAVTIPGLTVEAFHRKDDTAPADANSLEQAMAAAPVFGV